MFGQNRPRQSSRRDPKKPKPKTRKLKPIKPIRLLVKMRKRAGLTTFQFAALSYADYKYLQRLESGEADNPSRSYLKGKAESLVAYTSLFDIKDVNEVLKAGGYPPAPAPKFQLSCPHCRQCRREGSL